jgi:S-adenosylmethionine:tRNA ribosyltransferase-isomerase
MLPTAALDYQLPPDAIATKPVEPRDAAKLLVTRRDQPTSIEHRHVRDLPELLNPGDAIVFNTTRVLPARFFGTRVGTGGKVEGLYLRDIPVDRAQSLAGELRWQILLKAQHAQPGSTYDLTTAPDALEPKHAGVRLTLIDRDPDAPGAWIARVENSLGLLTTEPILERLGSTPLPPYILKARKDHSDQHWAEQLDRAAYQTVYAKPESHGASVAAPTAGLHFTPELLQRLEARGVRRIDVVLHVGVGTFKPIDAQFVDQHPMHSEWCSMTADAIAAVRETRAGGGRVLAVGTTSVRTLETYAQIVEGRGVEDHHQSPDSVDTRLLITPGYRYRWSDLILTNFHLPKSTLMALVAARLSTLPSPAVSRLQQIYREALAQRYRFYSYGDAMLIL